MYALQNIDPLKFKLDRALARGIGLNFGLEEKQKNGEHRAAPFARNWVFMYSIL
jgi:hypothetical protein